VVQSSVMMQRGNACTTYTNLGAANKEVRGKRLVPVLVLDDLVQVGVKEIDDVLA